MHNPKMTCGNYLHTHNSAHGVDSHGLIVILITKADERNKIRIQPRDVINQNQQPS